MIINYPLLLDGGLSNVLEEQGCNLNDRLWSAKLLDTNEESIIQAHISYLKAGAQCITTSSYQATVLGFMKEGYSESIAESLILKSVQLAEIAISRFKKLASQNSKPLIAASIGPYGAYLADGSEYHGDYDISDEELKIFHQKRINLLDKSNADFLACETIPSFQETKVLADILQNTKKPAWISFSCKDENHINDDTNIEECVEFLNKYQNIFGVGVNCSAPKYILGLIQAIKRKSKNKKIVIYPNSGEIYNANTKTWHNSADPNIFVEMTEKWISAGADIIGGCCRIGPEHIKSINKFLTKP